jgi:hypothetical protein
MAGQSGTNLPIYVVDGSTIAGLPASVNLASPPASLIPRIIPVLGRMPAAWNGYTTGSVVPDSDGDGYGDFAVGEFTTSMAGRVVVFR